eukprot:g11471.t1
MRVRFDWIRRLEAADWLRIYPSLTCSATARAKRHRRLRHSLVAIQSDMPCYCPTDNKCVGLALYRLITPLRHPPFGGGYAQSSRTLLQTNSHCCLLQSQATTSCSACSV